MKTAILRAKSAWLLTLFLLLCFIVASALVTRTNWSLGPNHMSPFSHAMPEEDVANLWSAGKLARMGKVDWLYFPNLFETWKRTQFGSALKINDWIYPPTVLLIGVPLSFLPLFQAYLLWDCATLLIAVLLLRAARLPWPILIAGLVGPATWSTLVLGQYGTLVGALVVAGLLMAPRYPVRAGIMLGFATLKPQPGVIVPVAWLAVRNWRAIAAAAALFSMMAVTVALSFGIHAWTLFFTRSSLLARDILIVPPPQPTSSTGVSVFWMARTMGASVRVSYGAQVVAAMAAIYLVYRAWRIARANALARMAFTVCLSLFVTPYGYASDMVAYSVGVAAMVSNNRWRLQPVDILLWLWPAYCGLATIFAHVLLTPLILAAAAARAWHQMRRPDLIGKEP